MATFSSFPGAAAGFAALLLLAVSAQVQVHAETTTPPGIAVLASSDQFIFTDDACTQGREPWVTTPLPSTHADTDACSLFAFVPMRPHSHPSL